MGALEFRMPDGTISDTGMNSLNHLHMVRLWNLFMLM